ncbi:MAG: sarcosine oxidase subunit gamma [Rhodospirillaceae bacterium]|jgi:sarcosine oxidase, subunit gamma|nr:sarcosine oxidase subunit gamma [Rhodospirillaceae bacterium]
MPETYLRQSPLAHLHLDARAVADAGLTGAGVEMSEISGRTLVNLRGDAKDPAFIAAVIKALGISLPTDANTVSSKRGGMNILWLGPNEWLVAGAGQSNAEKLGKALAGQHAAVTPVSDGRTVIHLAGDRARQVLAKGCPLDFHPMIFGPGQCVQTLLGRTDMLLHCVKTDTFDIYMARSFAEYAWTWLEDAAREFGLKVNSI